MRPEKITFDDVVNYIVEQLDRYTEEAIKASLSRNKEAIGASLNKEDIIRYLHRRIQDKLAQIDKSLDNILENEKYLALFNEHRRLKAVLKYHEEQNQVFPNDHYLSAICKVIYDSRDKYWNLAEISAHDNQALQLFCFTLIIRSVLKRNGISFKDIIKNSEVKNRYFSSGRLYAALNIYENVLLQKPAKSEATDHTDQKHFERRAEVLAKMHAPKEGLVTQLDLPKDADVAELAKAAKKIMIQEHPDKNSEADEGRFGLANELMQLNEKGVLGHYLAALKEHRANNEFHNKPK